MNKVGKRTALRIAMIVYTCVILLSITGCYHEKIRTVHEISMQMGETVQLTPENIPGGKSAEDYTWSCGSVLTLSGAGSITANEMGSSYASASLIYKGKEYFEYFEVTVETVVNELTLDETQAVLRKGGQLSLTALPDIEMPPFEEIGWKSSDESVVTVERSTNMHNFDDSMSVVTAVGAGNATVTAFFGDTEAQCQITVFAPTNADEMLVYIDALQDNNHFTFEGTDYYRMTKFKTSLSADELKDVGSAPNGKYLILWEDDSYGEGDSFDEAYDFTALLPPEYRPQSLAEVEYIIRAIEGEPIYAGVYEGGVKGFVRTADLVIENAVTGEIVKTLDTLQGAALPDKIYVSEDHPPEEYYGYPVKMSALRDRLLEFISKMWTEVNS